MPVACCPPTFCEESASTSRRSMERRERRGLRSVVALFVFVMLGSGMARAVAPVGDALEATKSDIRLKKFSAAAGELQRLAGAGNPGAQDSLAVFFLKGLSGARGA